MNILPEQYLVDIGMGIYVQIPDKKTIHQSAKDVFAKFLEDCKVERLDTASINLEEILEDYFAVRPPFENSEKKRKEFPDAFIAVKPTYFCVEVHGLSYDRDGIADGYDYDETYLEHCYLSGMRIHTIDDIDGDIITAKRRNKSVAFQNCVRRGKQKDSFHHICPDVTWRYNRGILKTDQGRGCACKT